MEATFNKVAFFNSTYLVNMNSIKNIYKLFKSSNGITIDSRNIEHNTIFFALKGENFDGNLFAQATLDDGCSYAIVDNENIAKQDDRLILVENVLLTLQKLATYHRQELNIPIIAITGTNGKTTTKEILSVVLSKKFNLQSTKGNFNNHIGVPLTLLSITEKHNFAVVEMGANHKGEIKELCEIARPNYGIITNIGKAHLEGFGSFGGVINTKNELYDYLKNNNGIIFQNGDNEILNTILGEYSSIKYGKTDDYFCHGEVFANNPFLEIMYVSNTASNDDFVEEIYVKTKLIGAYNFENILAAVCVGRYFDISNNNISRAIENYSPTNNRSQYIKTKNNAIILDAYNANPSSMKEAIENFSLLDEANKILILGDMLELGKYSTEEHTKIIEKVKTLSFEKVYFVGKEFSSILQENTYKNMNELYSFLKENPLRHKNILVKGSRGIKLEGIVELL